MEKTAEEQTTDFTDISECYHDRASTSPCAYTQLLLCVQDKSPLENHNLAPESSSPPPNFSAGDPKDCEPGQSDTDSMASILYSAASADTTINEEVPLSPSCGGTPSLDGANNVQMIGCQSSTPLHLFHPHETDEEVTPSSYDNAPSSSLPPSSSPPQIFSSSPFVSSQPSHVEIGHDYNVEDAAISTGSGCQNHVDHEQEQHELGDPAIHARSPNNEGASDNGCVPGQSIRKRPWVKEKNDTTPSVEDAHLPMAKRMKSYHAQAYLPPAPKRATMASQQQQFKKLIAPFRSPLIPRKDEESVSKDLAKSTSPLLVTLPPSTPKLPLTPQKAHPPHLDVVLSVTPAKTRVRTLKAASQFKPLFASAPSARELPIRLTPTIQSLERKLQLLRRAIKVKANDEEKTLVGLVKKWTEAGREAAYELWDLTKDSANNGSAWSGGGSKGKPDSEDRNWGWDTPSIGEGYPENETNTNMDDSSDACVKVHLEEDEEVRNNIGTMLLRLGIAPETLGWDGDVEAFVDRD